MNYVNKIKKDGVEYDIQDKRLDTGDLPAKMIEAIQQNGIAFDKYYLSVGGELQIVDELPEDYTGVAYLFASDDTADGVNIMVYENGSQKHFSYVLAGEMYCDNISFSQKVTVWETSDSYDALNQFFDNNFSNLKAGDIIIDGEQDTLFINLLSNTDIELFYVVICSSNSYLKKITYSNSGSGWSMNIDDNIPIGFNQAYLTHSFDELDSTLKQIVIDAIIDDDTNGVACTQAQWSAIKELLDKSLYINYQGYSLIKSISNGIDTYTFGSPGVSYGSSLEVYYNDADSLLFAKYYEA